MDVDDEPSATDCAFDDGGELPSLEVHLRASTDNLCPRALGGRGIVAVTVLVGGDDKLAAGFLKERRPEVGAGALPHSVVGRILGSGIGRTNIAGIGLRVGIEEGNVADGNEEGG